jgi:transcription elongation factor GreA
MERAATTAAPPRALNGRDFAVTADGLASLRREVEDLRNEKDREVAQQLRNAREFGPPTGNDEFWAIREDEFVLAARIARLEGVISRARVTVPATADSTVARIGATVVIEDLATGDRTRYRVVGGHDSSEDGMPSVSAVSAVGRAIIGRPEGSCADVTLPRGGTRRLRLARVEAANEAEAQDAQR